MKNTRTRSFLALSLLLATLPLGACGGSSDDESGTDGKAEPTRAAGGAGGGMFSDLSDEDIACLEDQGVSLPERPEGAPADTPNGERPDGERPEEMPEGGPPGGERPEGMAEGMEDLQTAMSECGIEMPSPPDGGPPTSGS